MIKKISEMYELRTVKKLAREIEREKAFTLKQLNCFEQTDDKQTDELVTHLDKLKKDRDYAEIVIENQEKFSPDFLMNSLMFILTVFSIIFVILIFSYSDALQPQIEKINEQIVPFKEQYEAMHTDLIELISEFSSLDDENKELRAEEFTTKANSIQIVLTPLIKQSERLFEEVNKLELKKRDLFIYFFINCLAILFLIILFSYTFLTYKCKIKSKALAIAFYKKKLKHLNYLIEKEEEIEQQKKTTENNFFAEQNEKQIITNENSSIMGLSVVSIVLLAILLKRKN